MTLAAAVSLACLVRDTVLFSIFYYAVSPDSFSYLGATPIRTRPYPIFLALTGASNDPIVAIWIQIILAAFAAGLIVFMIGRWSLLVAAVMGFLLVLDVYWAIDNRQILTESLYRSLSLICLACLVYQYERRQSIRPIWMLLAGLLYGWTILIRPSNLLLAFIVVGVYLGFTRSWTRAGMVAAGIALVFLSMSVVTLGQTGRFRLNGGTGNYLAFPLFSYHLFSPSNGPVSAAIDARLKECDPGIDYTKVVAGRTSDEYIWGKFVPCLKAQGWDEERISAQLTSAYLESLRAHPGAWLRNIVDWTAIFVTYREGIYEGDTVPHQCQDYKWCGAWSDRVRSPPDEAAAAEDWERSVLDLTSGWRQPYLVSTVMLPSTDSLSDSASHGALPIWVVAIAGLLWIGILVLVWLRAAGSIRFLALACIVLVWYTAVSVVAGGAFVGRYSHVLSPFYSLIAAVVLVALARLLVDVVAREHFSIAAPVRRLASVVLATVVVAAVLYGLVPPMIWQRAIQVRAEATRPFVHVQGNAYASSLATVRRSITDSLYEPHRSTLTLYENGRRLGPAHSQHATIFEEGHGHFSHWTSGLFFSTSDNSDPNLNGRRYEVGISPVPVRLTLVPYLLSGALLVLLFARIKNLRRTVEHALVEIRPPGAYRRLGDLGALSKPG